MKRDEMTKRLTGQSPLGDGGGLRPHGRTGSSGHRGGEPGSEDAGSHCEWMCEKKKGRERKDRRKREAVGMVMEIGWEGKGRKGRRKEEGEGKGEKREEGKKEEREKREGEGKKTASNGERRKEKAEKWAKGRDRVRDSYTGGGGGREKPTGKKAGGERKKKKKGVVF